MSNKQKYAPDKPRLRELSSRKLPPAIVLGLSSGGVAAVRSLAKRGIGVVALSYDQQPGNHTRCADVFSCPHPTRETDEFIGFLNDLCEELSQPSPVIISEDAYVEAILNTPRKLSNNMILPFSRDSRGITNKVLQVEAGIRAGVGVPTTGAVTGRTADSAGLGRLLPAIVKGKQADSSRQKGMPKTIFCNSIEELDEALRLVREYGAEAIVQNAIPGPVSALASACVFIDPKGRLVGAFSMRKLRAFPGGVGTYVKSEAIPSLIEATVSLCRELRYWGMAEVEYKWDSSDSKWKMIELNPRLWEQTALATASGVDFPYIIYQSARGVRESSVKFKEGIYWQDFFEDLYLARKTGQKTARVLGDFLSVAVRPHLVLADPHPALNRLFGRVNGFLRYRTGIHFTPQSKSNRQMRPPRHSANQASFKKG
jgi:D-aspartate ligase